MHKVVIKKEGFYGIDYDENPSDREIKITEDNFINAFRFDCEIEKDVTLRDIMIQVAMIEPFCNFISKYCFCNVDSYHKYLTCPKQKHESIEEIVIELSVEINKSQLPFKREHDIDVDFNWGVSGMGVAKEGDCLAKKGEKQRFTLTEFPEIIDSPVIISENCDLFETDKNGKCKVSPINPVPVSFLEVISGLYYEISFHGSPEQTKDFFESLYEEIDEREKTIDSGGENLIDSGVSLNSFIDHFRIREEVTEFIKNGIHDGSLCKKWSYVKDVIKRHFFKDFLTDSEIEKFREDWLESFVKKSMDLIESGEISEIDEIVKNTIGEK